MVKSLNGRPGAVLGTMADGTTIAYDFTGVTNPTVTLPKFETGGKVTVVANVEGLKIQGGVPDEVFLVVTEDVEVSGTFAAGDWIIIGDADLGFAANIQILNNNIKAPDGTNVISSGKNGTRISGTAGQAIVSSTAAATATESLGDTLDEMGASVSSDVETVLDAGSFDAAEEGTIKTETTPETTGSTAAASLPFDLVAPDDDDFTTDQGDIGVALDPDDQAFTISGTTIKVTKAFVVTKITGAEDSDDDPIELTDDDLDEAEVAAFLNNYVAAGKGLKNVWYGGTSEDTTHLAIVKIDNLDVEEWYIWNELEGEWKTSTPEGDDYDYILLPFKAASDKTSKTFKFALVGNNKSEKDANAITLTIDWSGLTNKNAKIPTITYSADTDNEGIDS